MSDLKQAPQLNEYSGSCHCGCFEFIVRLAPIKTVFTCNCSICSRNSYLWAFPATEEHLSIKKGEDSLRVYEFGNRARVHKFCPKCGTSVLAKQHVAQEGRTIAINARVIHDLDLANLEIKTFDGRSLEPAYNPPKAPDTLSNTEGRKIYNGNCHCGAVRYSVRSELLNASGPKVAACDCSICARNGYLWIYPRHEDIAIHGEDALIDYIFGKRTVHRFCGTCGVSLFNKPQDHAIDMVPTNVRAMNGVNVEELNVEKGYFPPILYFES